MLDILRDDLWKAIEATRNSRSLLTKITNTFPTLIPKKIEHMDLGNFRPIVLCNTIYKIFSKALANRLKKVLPKLISREHTSFVCNRFILDGIIIIHELIHYVQINKESCMLMKLYKVYDKVDCRF